MKATQAPPWALLEERGGPHWKSLARDYVPVALLELIPKPPAAVLDVGCFCGATGSWLKAKYPGVRVIGVELLAEAASEAGQKLDQVLRGRLEELDLSAAGIVPASLDLIILADVLEHMYDPWGALVRLRPLLKPDAVVLASIPNVRNLTILEKLAQGDFPYAESGLLDITHIRFFTWRGVQRLFAETGYRIEEATSNFDANCGTLLAALNEPVPLNIDTPLLQLKNQTREQIQELATLQFLLRAKPV